MKHPTPQSDIKNTFTVNPLKYLIVDNSFIIRLIFLITLGCSTYNLKDFKLIMVFTLYFYHLAITCLLVEDII